MTQQLAPLLCVSLWLLCLHPASPSGEKPSKFRYERSGEIPRETPGTRRFCVPSSGNQTAGGVSQKCGPGFYREPAGPHRGGCVPCSCSGFSSECDEDTGNCKNCRSNTTGDRCERCKEGHHRAALNQSCRACPCPSTRNNFAVACMDIGAGVMECLCKRGYRGAKCERCAFGYYGNPMKEEDSCKPCSCKHNLSMCDPLTGDVGKWDGGLVSMEQQLQNISAGTDPVSGLDHLSADASVTKTLLRNFSVSIKLQDPPVSQLGADAAAIRGHVSELRDEASGAALDLGRVSVQVNDTNMKAEDLLSEAGAVMTSAQALIKRQTEVKPGPSPTLPEQIKMLEAARDMVQDVSERSCDSQRDQTARGREEAHSLLETIAADLLTPVNQSAASLTASGSSLRRLGRPLSDAADAVDRLVGLNLRSSAVLARVEHLHPQLQGEEGALLRASEATRGLLGNVSDALSTLGKIRGESEGQAAQVDGARLALLTWLNAIFPTRTKVEMVAKAEEHAEELRRAAARLQQAFHNATGGVVGSLGTGPYGDIGNAIEEAEAAANLSSGVAGQTLKDVRAGDLANAAARQRGESGHLRKDASGAERDNVAASATLDAWKDRISERKGDRDSLAGSIAALADGLETIGGGTGRLVESAKTAASAANTTAATATVRLDNISQEVEKITWTGGITAGLLTEAEDAWRNLSGTLPLLEDKVRQVEALGGIAAPADANMTESISKIKDIIEETRNLVSRLSFATTFDGNGHVELRPPRNLEDIKAFTVVDLLINRHLPRNGSRRKRRQDKHRHGDAFVFYMGNKNTSGDYIGMAIRHKVLVCVYKLGGLVHEVETSQITSTDSPDMDRVLFHRVYQDAEVLLTRTFTSQQPVQLAPKRNLPHTTTGVLGLHPQSLVLYVGGYPEDFRPPPELDYPKFRGAIKVSYINDHPVSLFNYKRAVNMARTHLAVRIPRSEESDYYDGTGYGMALVKDPDTKKTRFFKFHTRSREASALLFYIGNKDTFFCLGLEGGFLVLRGRQAGQDLRVQSPAEVSLFDQKFTVVMDDVFTVYYRLGQISAGHDQTSYESYYIGGLPGLLRHRHNITAPPLRGCVRDLTANSERVDYAMALGVGAGCPVSLLGVRSATVLAPLSADPLFVRDHQPLLVSVGFRSTHGHGTLIRSGSEASVHRFQLSLVDGYVTFSSDNDTLRSDRRHNDGGWHDLSARRSAAGLEVSVDNVKATQTRPPQGRMEERDVGRFTGCVSTLYTRRADRSLTPADLSSLPRQGRDVILGACGLLPGSGRPEILPPAPGGSRCRPQRDHQLSQDSWLSYTVPQEDLNHRPHFSLDVKTTSTKGLILHVAGAGPVPLLALYIANGKIKMSLGRSRVIHHKQKSNDGNWHRVELSVEKSTFHLLVDGVRVTDGRLPNGEGSSLDLHNPVFLGADPSKHTKGHDLPGDGVVGCVRNFKMNEEALREPEASHKAPPCFGSLTEEGTYFGGGYVAYDKPLDAGPQFELVFELRPRRLSGLLFHAENREASLNVFLNETEVSVEARDGARAVRVSVAPPESLCDGEFHAVTVSRQHGVLRLRVDSEQKAAPLAPFSTPLDELHVGGTAKEKQAPVPSPFVGCLRHVRLNGSPLVLEAESGVGHVISGCPAD